MSAIYSPELKFKDIKKVSTLKEDAANDGYKEYKVTIEVSFSVYAEKEDEVENKAIEKLSHALS